MKFLVTFAVILSTIANASPTPTIDEGTLVLKGAHKRQLLPLINNITDSETLENLTAKIEAGLESDVSELALIVQAFVDTLTAIIPYGSPTALPAALASVVSVYKSHSTELITNALELVLNGLTLPPADLLAEIQEEVSGSDNSPNNTNPINPTPSVYPNADSSDAPYDQDENTLRSAIHIPENYTYGTKQPVILVPGTGNYGAQTFTGNFIKLLTDVDYADPVWLNIPGAQVADLQTNSEFVAYAINYISAISGNRNVSVISWSAGSLNMRWSGKYWPSTREKVNTHVAVSGDYRGSPTGYLLCPGFPRLPCEPAIIQQVSNSTFLATLRNNGGDSPYVPTTNVYSILDEIVIPQANEDASGYSPDARGVGVTNVELQNVCFAQAGGTVYTHEGVLYNPITFALAKDSLINGGAGQLSRIDVASECQKVLADGLDLEDLLITESTIPIAVYELLAYEPKVLTEPPIKAYAQNDTPTS